MVFESARGKIARANAHIREMRSKFDEFASASPYTLREDPRTNPAPIFFTIDKPLPLDLALLLGDAVHNLRTALDHFVWQATIGNTPLTRGQETMVKFPSGGGGKGKYDKWIKGAPLPESVKQFIEQLGAYEGGPRSDLAGLSALDNLDKHRVIAPVFGRLHIPAVRIAYEAFGGEQSMVAFEAGNYTFSSNSDLDLLHILVLISGL